MSNSIDDITYKWIDSAFFEKYREIGEKMSEEIQKFLEAKERILYFKKSNKKKPYG